MTRSKFYLAAAIIGFFVPPTLITYFWIDQGFDLVNTLNAMVDNTIALAVFLDITISSLVFLFWSYNESKDHDIKHWPWLIPANVFIGLCFALPLFLYWRECHQKQGAALTLRRDPHRSVACVGGELERLFDPVLSRYE